MRILNAPEVADWVRDELLNPARQRPIVAITTRPYDGSSWIDAQQLDEAIGDVADVVFLETGDATWELADALPPRLDAYGGAVRIWWPGLHVRSNPYDHRLHFVRSQVEAATTFDEIVEAVRGRAGAKPADLSVQEALPTAWDRAAAELSVGDVVVARVQNVVDYGAFIDVLPNVAGLAHKSEIDWTFVDDVARFVKPGQLVAVLIQKIDPADRRMELSIKRAFGAVPRPLPSLLPGGEPFEWEGVAPSRTAEAQPADTETRSDDLSQELDALASDRGRLAEQNKQLREQNQDLRKEVRSLKDRFELLERRVAHEADPLSDERAFVRAVRTAYARMLDEDDRLRHPLLRMRVGPQFLDSLRVLEGADIEKVLEVCAQVAGDFAHELPSREVHQLRAGRAGSPRLRTSDDAQAWRCALQVKSPSARRLHWWRVPGSPGATIEFASADVHDEFGIT